MKNHPEFEHYGGQALIEGVLMRGKKYVAAAFRHPDGKIVTRSEKLGNFYNDRIRKIPFLRGLIILWDALILGSKYLSISAEIQSGKQLEDDKENIYLLVFSLVFAIVLAILIFFIIPTFIIEWISKLGNFGIFITNSLEGLVRLAFLFVYLILIGKMEEIKRVFAYHGAEHKTINAYEHNKADSVNNIMRFPVEHPRCGTSFLLTLIIISIVIYSLLGELSIIWKIISRVAFIPLITMVAYEIIRYLGKIQDTQLGKLLSKPNLMMQRLTTREPSPDMVEVAFTAFHQLLQLEDTGA